MGRELQEWGVRLGKTTLAEDSGMYLARAENVRASRDGYRDTVCIRAGRTAAEAEREAISDAFAILEAWA